jgi:ribosomal protein S18 acetylase RimI-like enzyme
MTDVHLRPARPDDRAFIIEMLVAAVNWAPGRSLAVDQILADPAFAHYVTDWMRPDDLGVVATSADGTPIGAAWLRYLPADDPGYGFVRADIPELSIGVRSSLRGQGIGRSLLRALLAAARDAGVPAVSLSVERANAAARLYAAEGFRVVISTVDADTMLVDLR